MSLAITIDCGRCGETNPASGSVCAECGAPLERHLRAAADEPCGISVHPVTDCQCGGEWECTRCVMWLLDNNLPLDRAPSLTELEFDALTAEGMSR